MGRVVFLLDEVERLAGACVRARRREASSPVPPALRIMHDEFGRVYLTGDRVDAGEHQRLWPVTLGLTGWRPVSVRAGDFAGRRHQRLRCGSLGEIPLREPQSQLLHHVRAGIDAAWCAFVVDHHCDAGIVAGVGRGRFCLPR
ncbi:hypothetical protein [Solwaraspora sp. WMMA2065]|uniref:hypothetical protein n=1 Tax=Solwaraspora sp. WMMA2065 TaxID=3015166 RepID=UPI00259BE746|nr:hypothetical protein [Solwaraspora sp. WMMA2065]WJK33137.1 hypothetical protein O7610_20800 [Solwaraspora sp. WMMA2065]